MKRKWKILLACVVVVAAVAAMTVGICARYVLHYPAVGGDFEISFIRAGETLEDITEQIDQDTLDAIKGLVLGAERGGTVLAALHGSRRAVWRSTGETVRGYGISMAKNSWNSFGPCCRSSDKEGAHMKRTWKVLLVCVVAVAALAGYFFLLPAPAGGEDFQLLEVRQDGRDLTASLRPEQLADLEATMRGASRFRWKNPVGVYPLEADTVMLLGANGESVILVGSQGRFAVDGYPLHDGETLLAEVQNILAS